MLMDKPNEISIKPIDNGWVSGSYLVKPKGAKSEPKEEA